MTGYYEYLKNTRKDSDDLTACIDRTVDKLKSVSTTANRPGMLLGKIQSGKTRGFLGIIAKGFDEGYDLAIILTKSATALAEQTVNRIRKDFEAFYKNDELQILDIMKIPEELTRFELRQKMILVGKKQHVNLDRIIKLLTVTYPELKDRRVLLIDDEADLASIRFVKNRETELIEQGKIAQQMDLLRTSVKELSFLQVTATPYSLYLQPDEYSATSLSNFVFLPKKPAFTELLPIHSGYVGGDDYFGDFEENDPRSVLYAEVPLDENDVLRKKDERKIRSDRIMTSPNIRILRRALMSFIVGVVVRRWQQAHKGEHQKKYSLILHNDTKKDAHKWQWETVGAVLDKYEELSKSDDALFRDIFDESFKDLSQSVEADGGNMPEVEYTYNEVCSALQGGDIMREQVNSDKKMTELLDENAELRLRTPFNIFIGGNILDRGITIPNLLGFYYGRNPKTMQADTVLQHSRMYGNRDRRDLSVTRFYTSREIYDRLKKIHDFEVALREAFEKGAHDKGVVFIQTDQARRVVPCAPNKIKMSDVYTIRPGKRMLPIGFESLPKTKIEKIITEIESLIPAGSLNSNKPQLTNVQVVHDILNLIEKTLQIDPKEWDWDAFHATIDYFSKVRPNGGHPDQIWIMGYTDRSIARVRETGRFSNAPDTKQQRDIAERYATQNPMLLLFRQEGEKEQGWAGYPFWWPVLIAPTEAEPCVYASKI